MDPYTLLVLIVATALLFEFANGWNDAANSIATIVSTRVLTPLTAVAWAAFWNFIAALLGVLIEDFYGVAKTMGKGLVHLDMVNEYVLLAGLLGAIIWTGVCTWLGLPISVSHSLMGGYGGAAVAMAGYAAIIGSAWLKPMIFIFLAPVIGMIGAVVFSILTTWIVRRQPPLKVDRWFRRLQLVSAAGYSLGHGTNDAQKGMGIIWAALLTYGALSGEVQHPPWWVIISCHAAIAGGTLAGGWRVIKTMGQRITKLTPFGGFSAETAGALTLLGTAHAGIPVSTTHVITGSIIGVGATRRITAVRWGLTGRILWAWVLTIPGAALMGALLFYLFAQFVNGAS
ncbi:inorganic phosphate transporter [Acidobacteriia bacterium AH_259_A11_L15]|nr:inorganic phosphate transporter [Acidobacteriia bacterium AH_259_A11_L15]